MPGLIEILSYEVGIRLTQALVLLSGERRFPDFEIEAALLRLESSTSRLHDQIRDARSRLAEIVKSCADSRLSQLAGGSDAKLVEGLQQRLVSARENHIAFLDQSHPEFGRWFRLGLAIADGADNSWSDGRPQIVPRDYPEDIPEEQRLPYPMLVMTDAVQPNWEWQDSRLIDDLIGQVGQSLEQLFPDRRVREGYECCYFSGLEFKRFWGWHAVELGLLALAKERLVPHWDGATRTLYLGPQRIHAYATDTGNQVPVLKAFQASGWQERIPCPIADPKKANQTVISLNKTLKSGPIGFSGGIRGISWYFKTTTEGR